MGQDLEVHETEDVNRGLAVGELRVEAHLLPDEEPHTNPAPDVAFGLYSLEMCEETQDGGKIRVFVWKHQPVWREQYSTALFVTFKIVSPFGTASRPEKRKSGRKQRG